MEGYFENFCNVAVHSAAESFSYAENWTVWKASIQNFPLLSKNFQAKNLKSFILIISLNAENYLIVTHFTTKSAILANAVNKIQSKDEYNYEVHKFNYISQKFLIQKQKNNKTRGN